MTIKEIWKEFANSVIDASSKTLGEIREIASSTFGLLKTTLIDFVGGIFTWFVALVQGVASILWQLIKIVFAALVAALKSTLGIVYDKIVEWIKHL